MDERINQAINNLQAIANLAIDDDAIAEIATATVALLGEYAAQPRVQRTAFAAGVVAGFVGFLVGLFLGAC